MKLAVCNCDGQNNHWLLFRVARHSKIGDPHISSFQGAPISPTTAPRPMTPRTARSLAREEAADENESEDDLLVGPCADEAGVPSRRRKESPNHVLQSDPPWSGQSMACAKESQNGTGTTRCPSLASPKSRLPGFESGLLAHRRLTQRTFSVNQKSTR